MRTSKRTLKRSKRTGNSRLGITGGQSPEKVDCKKNHASWEYCRICNADDLQESHRGIGAGRFEHRGTTRVVGGGLPGSRSK